MTTFSFCLSWRNYWGEQNAHWRVFSESTFLYFKYQRCNEQIFFFFNSVPDSFRCLDSTAAAKQKPMNYFAKKMQNSQFVETVFWKHVSPQTHSLGPNTTFLFPCIWHSRPSAAWLGLAWCICLWKGGGGGHLHISLPTELLRSAAK